MRLARGLGIPECPTSALSRHIPEKRFEMAILQAPQFYHVPSFTRSPGSMPLDFCSWQSGCRAASPRAHGDCGPAGLVSHFSHQLPETPTPAQSPEQGHALSQRQSFRNLLLRGGGTNRGGGRIPKERLHGNALPVCDPVGGREQSKQPLPCPLCGGGQVHRPVWTAALSVRLFGRCWLIDGGGQTVNPLVPAVPHAHCLPPWGTVEP